jgi:membrane fusion protein, multidrug efflux system
MPKTATIRFFIVTGTMFLVFRFAGTDRRAEAFEAPAPEVEVAAVQSQKVQIWDEYNGRVGAIEAVTIQPRVSGYIDRIDFTEGSEVKAGDLLFVIDQRPYRNALNNANAQLVRAEAVVGLAQLRAQRAQSLFATKAVSRDLLDERNAELEQGRADVDAARAAVATAKLNLDFTEVRTPVSGRVGRAQLTKGNLVQSDQTVLATIVSQDPIFVYFDCDENSYLRYQELARNGLRANSQNAVRVGLSNEPGFPHVGTVDFLDNQVDPATGTIRARAVLANPDRIFTPGLYAHVSLEASAEFTSLLVADKAVLTDQTRKYVYVVGPDSKAVRKDVVLGRQIGELRVVQSGLSVDDKVVVSGVQKIFYPGMSVKPNLVEMDVSPASVAEAAATVRSNIR